MTTMDNQEVALNKEKAMNEALSKFVVGRRVASICVDQPSDDIEIVFDDGARVRLSTLGGIDLEEMVDAEGGDNLA